jgi:hypothetical protein
MHAVIAWENLTRVVFIAVRDERRVRVLELALGVFHSMCSPLRVLA